MGMRQLGYNIRLEHCFADSVIERLPELVAEIVGPLRANLAVQKATNAIPIVMGTGADPVGFRVVKTLAIAGASASYVGRSLRAAGSLHAVSKSRDEFCPE